HRFMVPVTRPLQNQHGDKDRRMDIHATLIRRVIGPIWARWEGSSYLRHYLDLARSQFDSPEAVKNRRFSALKAILTHAVATVPYYQRLFRRLKLDAGDIQDFDDLRQVPLLTKSDVCEQGRQLLSDALPRQRLHRKKTSGSTGVALEIYV